MHGKSSRKDEKLGSPINKIIIASVIGSVLYFAMLAVFAAAALKKGMEASSYMPVGLVLGAVSGFLSGFTAVRPIKEKGALYGALTGFIQSLINSIVLFIVNGGAAGTGIFILAAIVIILAAVGGIAAVNLKIKKKY